MKNPVNPPSMKEARGTPYAGADDSVHNHGFATSGAPNGQTIVRAFGLDRSTEAGTASDERETGRTMGGGVNNLKDSLVGASASQGQARGKRDTIKP